MGDIEIQVGLDGGDGGLGGQITLPASLLRDLFAGMAMQPFVSLCAAKGAIANEAEVAAACYRMADALMAERAKREGT